MTQYREAAAFYDLLYAAEKDYAGEAEVLAELIRSRAPKAQRLLDVGCGTGNHASALAARGFHVDGIDLEPEFVEIAREKLPNGAFTVGDMVDFELPRSYDAVLCLFSAIGYVLTVPRLQQAIACMARHLAPGGVLIVDPWFTPGDLTDRWVSQLCAKQQGLAVSRVSRTLIEGNVSTLEFEYLIGRPAGIERRSERHQLGLFTQEEMESAFTGVGLKVERLPKLLRTRGIYVGQAME